MSAKDQSTTEEIVERDRAAAYFADPEEGTQLLICSEIGSEGRNFQFAHHLVLFDLPLQPDLLEQRIGRLDRIGQSETIRIHVPYLEGSAGETLLRWYRDGLHAFRAISPAAATVYERLAGELDRVLESGSGADQLIDRAAALNEQLSAEMEAGRDRLLELHSHRPAEAERLLRQIAGEEAEADLRAYLESYWDAFGVKHEPGPGHSTVLHPGRHMLHDRFPDDMVRSRGLGSNLIGLIAVLTVLNVMFFGLGGARMLHFMDSPEFCGTTCHKVMNPEWVAYQNSPHAHVRCIDCHVGEGAEALIDAKLNGLWQIVSATFDLYERPIPTPVHNLRPARETCEKCHWPQKFYSRTIRMERHYLRDEENSEWDINLVMKVGAKFDALGLEEGIHWHINPDVKVEYAATDYRRQNIPWVRLTDKKTGLVTVFESVQELSILSTPRLCLKSGRFV